MLVAFAGAKVSRERVYRAVWNPTTKTAPRWRAAPIGHGFPVNRTAQAIAGDAWDWRKVYVGTGHGVFRGVFAGEGQPWLRAPYNKGLPRADVRDLAVSRGSRKLLAATFGNGAWAVTTRRVK